MWTVVKTWACQTKCLHILHISSYFFNAIEWGMRSKITQVSFEYRFPYAIYIYIKKIKFIQFQRKWTINANSLLMYFYIYFRRKRKKKKMTTHNQSDNRHSMTVIEFSFDLVTSCQDIAWYSNEKHWFFCSYLHQILNNMIAYNEIKNYMNHCVYRKAHVI